MATDVEAALAQWTADAAGTKACPSCEGKQYHHGFGEHGHDPDWCSECGGAGFVAAFSEIEQMQRALDAAAAERAEAGAGCMEIIRAVAAIGLFRDQRPDDVDILCIPGVSFHDGQKIGLTPDHVRQARAIVAAAERKVPPPTIGPASSLSDEALQDDYNRHCLLWDERAADEEGHSGSPGEWIVERLDELRTEAKKRGLSLREPERKEVMPPGTECASTSRDDTTPLTAGPIPEAGASPNEHDWDAISERLSAETERLLAAAPSPQPPAPAEGAPDVAGLVERLRGQFPAPPNAPTLLQALFRKAADALTAQAAEIERLKTERDILGQGLAHLELLASDDTEYRDLAEERDAANAALAAKEAEIERLKDERDQFAEQAAMRDNRDADMQAIMGINNGLKARCAELEAALRPFAKEAERWTNQKRGDHFRPYDGEAGENMDFTVGDLRHARAALAGKEPKL